MARTTRTNLIIGTIAALGTVAVGIGAVTVGGAFASADFVAVAMADEVIVPGAYDGSTAADAETVPAGPAAADTFVPGAPAAAAPIVGGESDGDAPSSPDAPRSPDAPTVSVRPAGPLVPTPLLVDDEGPTAELVSVECGPQIVLEFALWSRDGINDVVAGYHTWAGHGTAELTDLGWNRYRLTVFDSKFAGLTGTYVVAADDAGNSNVTAIGSVCNL